MLNHRWSLSCIVVVAGAHGLCAAAQETHCTGALGNVAVRGNLSIAARCQLTGTEVRGNVTLFSGGSLIARDVTIRGNLEARRADFVAIEGSRIDGNVDLDELVGDSSNIQSTEIRGNASLTSNRSAFELLNNEIDGNVRASRNTGGLSISGNSIDGNLECSGNTPAPVGVGNRVDDEPQGQCRNLRRQERGPQPPTADPPPSTPPSSVPATPPAAGARSPPTTPATPPTGGARPPSTTPATPPTAGARPTPPTPPAAGATPPSTTPATPPPAGSPTAAPIPPPATTPPATGNFGSRDTTPPTLTLRGAPRVSLTINSPYADAGATATDSTDGDLTSRIAVANPVNTALLGTFTITYSVTDRSGNAAMPLTRTVTVEPADATGGGGGGALSLEIALGLLLLTLWRARSNRVPRTPRIPRCVLLHE